MPKLLLITAASIGFFHTLFGPDHYIPFIMMSKARKWSPFKTAWITFLCGLGHVFSSVLLGFIGIALGWALGGLTACESIRGSVAAWLLISFGFVYFLWGLRQAYKNRAHTHLHVHDGGELHSHEHLHVKNHSHVHGDVKNITPWVLFTIFVFGPCEPLIPLLMYPAVESSMMGVAMVTLVFATVTISTMLALVMISTYVTNFIPFRKMERYMHAIAGFTIFLCGVSVQFLGL
jgi:nickel/cobalt transporter (NicO) family protein